MSRQKLHLGTGTQLNVSILLSLIGLVIIPSAKIWLFCLTFFWKTKLFLASWEKDSLFHNFQGLVIIVDIIKLHLHQIFVSSTGAYKSTLNDLFHSLEKFLWGTEHGEDWCTFMHGRLGLDMKALNKLIWCSHIRSDKETTEIYCSMLLKKLPSRIFFVDRNKNHSMFWSKL